MICGVCGADFSHPALGSSADRASLLGIHQRGEHNGARDLVDIESMRDADAAFPTTPALAPAFGLWSNRPENARAVAANERAGFMNWPLPKGVPPRPEPTSIPGPGRMGSR